MMDIKVVAPARPEWEWCFGGDWYSFRVSVPRAPKAFYRLTQKLVLGIHWRRIADGR